jgi:ABC-type tungstate transport system permease subunit
LVSARALDVGDGTETDVVMVHALNKETAMISGTPATTADRVFDTP